MYSVLLLVLIGNLFSCGCNPLFVNGDRTLRLVNLLYRHGDRTPVSIYPSDPYQMESWPQGLGQLTTLGMRMHYELGHWLRQRYILSGFLNETYNMDSLHIRSTDFDRTLMSAETDLAGFYPPVGDQKWNETFTWMPLPVHTIPIKQDYLLRMNGPLCPRYNTLLSQTVDTSEYKDIELQYKDFLNYVTLKSNYTEPLTLMSIFKVEDPLFVEAVHGLTWPEWTNVTDFYPTLKYLSDSGMYFLYNSKEKSRLKGGVLLGEIIENMVNKSTTSNPTDLRKKVFQYSAHDTTLAAMMSALQVYNRLQPPLASCIGFELWEEVNGQYTVDVWFRNDTTQPPYPLVLPGCSASCPLDQFISLTKDRVPVDVQAECGNPTENFATSTSIVILLIIAIVILALILVTLLGMIIYRCRNSRSKRGHVRLPTDDMAA